jgi:hypothetical protein
MAEAEVRDPSEQVLFDEFTSYCKVVVATATQQIEERMMSEIEARQGELQEAIRDILSSAESAVALLTEHTSAWKGLVDASVKRMEQTSARLEESVPALLNRRMAEAEQTLGSSIVDSRDTTTGQVRRASEALAGELSAGNRDVKTTIGDTARSASESIVRHVDGVTREVKSTVKAAEAAVLQLGEDTKRAAENSAAERHNEVQATLRKIWYVVVGGLVLQIGSVVALWLLLRR